MVDLNKHDDDPMAAYSQVPESVGMADAGQYETALWPEAPTESSPAGRSPYVPSTFLVLTAVSSVAVAVAGWLAAFITTWVYARLPAHPDWVAPQIDPLTTGIGAFAVTWVIAAALFLLAVWLREAAGVFSAWLAGIALVAVIVVPLLSAPHLAAAIGPVVVRVAAAVVAVNLLGLTHRFSQRT